MRIDLPGHVAPAGGFEVPLEMLSACHHRVERQCATLRKLVTHLGTSGVDANARMAAAAVLRYFDTAAKDHHADEETDLFPALVESMAGSDAVCIRALIEALTLEHRALESHWRRLRISLLGIAAGASLPLTAADVEPFIVLYERHIAREESELLPMAQRLLTDEALDRIGKAMRERRGITEIE
ncbi:MAG: hemerythrin domain-containing protein [Rubrivivax sp.]